MTHLRGPGRFLVVRAVANDSETTSASASRELGGRAACRNVALFVAITAAAGGAPLLSDEGDDGPQYLPSDGTTL